MNLFQLKTCLLLAGILCLTSCEQFIGNGINEDPNNPVSVPITAQTPAIQIALADVVGGSFSRMNASIIQHVSGFARQCRSFSIYTGMTPNRFDTPWQIIYEDILNELKIAKEVAEENKYHHYVAIMDVMTAYTLMMATDVWDDMPWTEALQGMDNTSPAYDSQAKIYADIYTMLDNAIALLQGSPGPLSPKDEELYYNGDSDKWLKAAHAIKARALLHDEAYAQAATEAQAAFNSSDDNMAFQYPDANSAANWYRFNRDRTGDIEFSYSMRNLLMNLNDTCRLAAIDQPFTTAHTYLVADFLQELITYREMQFIIAEADIRANLGGTSVGYEAYLNGIKASFKRFGLEDDAYENYIAQESINPGAGNLSLEALMTQKYIAMFLQPEAYADWRRTNIPDLLPTAGSVIPVRWHYGSNEYLFNSNSPTEGEVDIFTDRVGWNR